MIWLDNMRVKGVLNSLGIARARKLLRLNFASKGVLNNINICFN